MWNWRKKLVAGKREGKRPQRATLSLESLESRDVPSLTPISSSAGYPYSAIVELQATFPDHRVVAGTGVMVDSFHVLTAGHVLYSSLDGGYATQIIATPELSGSSGRFGTAYMTKERTTSTFIASDRAHPGMTIPGDADIGLITLNRTIGNSTGWMTFSYDTNNADFAKGTNWSTAGYPATGGYNGTHMEFSSGQVAGLTPDGSMLEFYQSSITAYKGQSGSPVWRSVSAGKTPVVYAIYAGSTTGTNPLNYATRITPSLYNELRQWIAADAVPSAPPAAPPSGGGTISWSGL